MSKKKYLVFYDKNGFVIGKPKKVKDEFEADAMMEQPPFNSAGQVFGTKGELLKSGYGLCEEDFEEVEK